MQYKFLSVVIFVVGLASAGVARTPKEYSYVCRGKLFASELNRFAISELPVEEGSVNCRFDPTSGIGKRILETCSEGLFSPLCEARAIVENVNPSPPGEREDNNDVTIKKAPLGQESDHLAW
jgi:hypothetical protein